MMNINITLLIILSILLIIILEKNLIQSMFRLKNDNFQSLNAFKKRIKRNDTFSKNKLSLNNLNKKSNDKGVISNFPTKINFEHRNFNSLNYI